MTGKIQSSNGCDRGTPVMARESNCTLALAALPFESEENVAPNSLVYRSRYRHVRRPCPTGTARYLDPFEPAVTHDSDPGSQPNRAALVQRCAGLGGEDSRREVPDRWRLTGGLGRSSPVDHSLPAG